MTEILNEQDPYKSGGWAQTTSLGTMTCAPRHSTTRQELVPSSTSSSQDRCAFAGPPAGGGAAAPPGGAAAPAVGGGARKINGCYKCIAGVVGRSVVLAALKQQALK